VTGLGFNGMFISHGAVLLYVHQRMGLALGPATPS
jgi:hypothetical protein